MKTTYLINKKQEDGNVRLAVATSSEWLSVVKQNRQLPTDQQRYFIVDYIADINELDRMVIEVPMDTYRDWHKEHMARSRNRSLGRSFQHLSLDAITTGAEGEVHLEDVVSTGEQVEDTVCNRLLLDSLQEELTRWKPWANDMLELYLQGEQRTCAAVLSRKLGVSPQVIRKYKRQFKEFCKKFFSGVSL